MRLILGFLGLVGAALALTLSASAAAPNWQTRVTRTADGAFLVGNPNARVKLVEYMSYTCPHCAAFSRESAAVLRGQMIKSGTVSLEERNLVRDQLDLAAALLARCAGPAGFDKLSTAFFAQQDTWLPAGIQFEQANGFIALRRAHSVRVHGLIIENRAQRIVIERQARKPEPVLAHGGKHPAIHVMVMAPHALQCPARWRGSGFLYQTRAHLEKGDNTGQMTRRHMTVAG